MARSGYTSRPGRTLLILGFIGAALAGLIGAGAIWSDAQWSPKLALDLEGGTQIILTPQAQQGETGEITSEQLAQAVAIIRQRVDGSGVAEAEVTTQGRDNIVVALPGKPDEKTKNLVKQSAELNFRAVLVAEQVALPQPTATGSPGAAPSPGASPSVGASPSASAAPSATAAVNPAPTQTNRRAQQGLVHGQRTGATQPAPAGSAAVPTGSASVPAPSPGASQPAPQPTDGSDLAQITPELQEQFTALDCNDLDAVRQLPDNPRTPIVTCSEDSQEKYILGPVEVQGTHIKSATAGLGTNSQGATTGEWQVQLEFDGTGTRQFADVTTRLAALTDTRNRFAIVLDRLVVSAPSTNERIPSGQAQISGSFTQASSTALAQQLKFGALPISFDVRTEETISALLGGEQLRRGLLAGLVGLILVVLYSLLQYRFFGFVTVASLLVVGLFTYLFVVLLGWRQGYRLSLPGVTGLIVSIGITADSFIVFFERIRDEVREGRALVPAVEAGWLRARRTILVSDAVSLIAAVVLYVLAVGGVRGFAFTLGLTTLVDVLIVIMFTKPVVTLLARTRFFSEGRRFSGFEPSQLGRTMPAYAGRGRVRPPQTRAPAAARAVSADDPFDPDGDTDLGSRQPAGAGARAGGRGGGSRGSSGSKKAAPRSGDGDTAAGGPRQSIAERRAAERAASAGSAGQSGTSAGKDA